MIEYLLILGCRVRGDAPEEILKMRIDAAADYLREHENVVSVACGGIVHSDQAVSEAQAIKTALMSQGIIPLRILLEDQSQTTAENFINAARIIDSNSADISFITSDFHVRRAGIIAKRCGYINIRALSAPSPKSELRRNRLREVVVFPSAIFMRKRPSISSDVLKV